ncbi:MAG: PAS domain S-box protein [Anaerolineae bacterium]|nr:PAS domain S-box protein [Anaerolineae bacterium]
MDDTLKTHAEPLDELAALRQRVADLESAQAEHNQLVSVLRQIEEAYRALVDHSLQGLLIIQDGRVVFTNQAAAEMSGYTIEEILAQTPEERLATIHPEDRAVSVQRESDRYAGQQVTPSAQMRMLRKDGSAYWVEFYVNVIEYQGRPASQIAIIDITERKQAELELRQTRHRLDQMFQTMVDGMVMVDMDGQIIYTNPAAARILEVRQDTITGRYYNAHEWQHVDLQRRPYPLDQLPVALALGQRRTVEDLEHGIIAPNGEVKWLSVNAAPLVDENGTVYGAIASFRDITAHKQAERRLSEARQMLQQVIDHLPLSIFWKDTTLTYLGCNQHFANRTNLKNPGDIVGKTDYDLTLHDQTDAYRAEDRRVIDTGCSLLNMERERARDSEAPYWTRTSKVPLRDESGQIFGVLGVSEDITERKLAEQERIALAIEKQEIDILANFITVASHEFKTPLSILNTGLYVLQNSGEQPLPDHHLRHLTVMKEQITYLQELVEGLLTMSTLDSSPGLTLAPTSLTSLVENAITGVSTQAERQGVALSVEIAPNLPLIQASARDLQAAINHLARNAIQHTTAPGSVTLRAYPDDGGAVLEISDTGSGISPEHLPHIFDRFYRVEEARTDRGAGLGLSIARKVVDLHGGTLTVESAPGAGSTFRIRLPVSLTP